MMRKILFVTFLAMLAMFGCRAGAGCNGPRNGGGCSCSC